MHTIAQEISKTIKADISIESVNIRILNRAVLNNILILDNQNDTLIYAKELVAAVNKINRKEKKISLSRVSLINPKINFTEDSTRILNIQYFIENFSKKDTIKKTDTINTPWDFSLYGMELKQAEFIMRKFDFKNQDQINFDDLHLKNLNISLSNFKLPGDTIKFKLNQLDLEEQSGIKLNQLVGDISIHPNQILIKNFKLHTPLTQLNAPILSFNYNSYDDFSDFLNKINMNIHLDSSVLSTKTLSYIVPELGKIPLDIKLSGKIRGPVSNLKIRNLKVYYADSTYINTSVSINGLPNMEQTFLLADLKELRTNALDISYFLSNLDEEKKVEFPPNLMRLERIQFRGNITGLINDLVLFGNIKTKLGDVTTDLGFKQRGKDNFSYKGAISTKDFDMGKFMDNEESFGKLSISASVDGNLLPEKKVNAYTDANIESFEFNGYNYHDLTITGNLANNKYDGAIKSGDPNFNLNFLGRVDFSNEIPTVNFSAYVPKANLSKLNIDKEDSTSTLSFLLTANFTGSNFDNINGQLKIVNSVLRRKNQALRLKKFYLFTNNTKDRKIITLNSDYLDAELSSKYDQTTVVNSIKKLVFDYFPELKSDTNKIIVQVPVDSSAIKVANDIDFNLTLKKTNKIFDMFMPDVKIANNTRLEMGYNINEHEFKFNTTSQNVTFKEKEVINFNLSGYTKDSTLHFNGNTDLHFSESLSLEKLRFNVMTIKNDIALSLSWENEITENLGPGNIELYTKLKKNSKNSIVIESKILPSDIYLAGSKWMIDSASIQMDTNSFTINDFSLNKGLLGLNINGVISEDPADTLEVEMKNIDLSIANWFTAKLNYFISGNINGVAKITNIYNEPIFYSDLNINQLAINDSLIGDGLIYSNWNNKRKSIDIHLGIVKNRHNIVQIDGFFIPENNIIDFHVAVRDFELYTVAPSVSSFMKSLNGRLIADIKLKGNTKEPLINGDIYISDGAFVVDYTNVNYLANSHIVITDNIVDFQQFELQDKYGNKANATGKITNNYFKNIELDLLVDYEKLLVLNTTSADNETFYGNAIVTGQALIKGPPNELAFNLTTETNTGTRLFVPLNSARTASKTDFLTFTSDIFNTTETEEIVELEKKPSKLKIDIDLLVSPETETQIIIDPTVGDIIKAQGRGDLKISLVENDLSIFGDYVIEKGDYLFTLQNIINKKFRVEKGSSISWNKDPVNAEINMLASYSTKAALSELLMSPDAKYTEKIPVDCQIFMTGNMTSPNIKFGIDLPTADSDTKSQVDNIINTDEEMSKQFLALLVINSFMPDMNMSGISNQPSAGEVGIDAGTAMASELLSNQLSHWLSQLSNDFDIGINYRPGDAVQEQEVELALSTQLLNDRVMINGNVDVGGNSTAESSSNIAGEFTVEVKLNKRGTIRLKGFNRSNEGTIKEFNAQYTQGVGIFYLVNFNTFKEFINELRSKRKKEKVAASNS